jgi:endonuclease/exonuclease/phosphatase (EEP) superfamily protein YafD
LGAIALVLRRWRWLGVVVAVALIQIWTIHPYWPHLASAGNAAVAAPQPISGKDDAIKIVSLNVWVRSDRFEEVRQYLAASQADVIGLVEVTPRWKAELAPIFALYPYRIDCVGTQPGCQEILLSKRPFTRSGAAPINGRLPFLTWAELAPPESHPDAPPVTIAVAHIARPLVADPGRQPPAMILDEGLPDLIQTGQADLLAARLRSFGPDLILMGDLNAAPWSRVQHALRQASGLDNQGYLAPSWPSWLPGVIRLPIDHVMTRGQPRLLSFEPGPDVGSDHLPVEAVVSLAQP